ncbi:MAG: DinB family protein [Candidatus Thorarchaeota archaeon]
MKKSAINLLRAAEVNLLNSFKGIQPDEVTIRPQPEFNSISWIVGHCFVHFHMVLCLTCQDTRLFSKDVMHYYRYATTKEEIDTVSPPFSFDELVDEYLGVSEKGFSYLDSLDDDAYPEILFPEINETLEESIQRIALHYLGHVGQIVLIRKAIGNPGPTFVGGLQEPDYIRMFDSWRSWWSESKESFSA